LEEKVGTQILSFCCRSSEVQIFYPIESWVFLGKIRECGAILSNRILGIFGENERMLPWLQAIDSAFYCGESKIQKTLLEKRELHMERELLLD